MNTQIRILQVTQIAPRWGVDLYRLLAQAFADNNKYTVTTVFIGHAAQPDQVEAYAGKVHFLNVNNRKRFWRIKAFYKLWQLCHNQRFDVVFCHHYKPLALVDIIVRLLNIPKCFNIHHNMGNFRYLSRKLFARYVLSKRWRFITISQAVKNNVVHAGIAANRIQVIYNAVDIAAIKHQLLTREQARIALGLVKEDFVFGTLGRLVQDKGQIYLLRAFAAIRAQLPSQCKCVLIGSGELRTYLIKQSQQLGVIHQVLITDTVAPQAAHYLRAFDCFVFPSIQEGFGLALVEAMLAELPIIATRAGGIPEVMGECGILVPAQDTSQLAQAMLAVYSNLTTGKLKIDDYSYHKRIQLFTQEVYQQQFRDLAL
jgi:glycosyltransferase involved in cell wall biosynthesis